MGQHEHRREGRGGDGEQRARRQLRLLEDAEPDEQAQQAHETEVGDLAGPPPREADQLLRGPQDDGGEEGDDHGEGDDVEPVGAPDHEEVGGPTEDIEDGLGDGQSGEGEQLEEGQGRSRGPRRVVRLPLERRLASGHGGSP